MCVTTKHLGAMIGRYTQLVLLLMPLLCKGAQFVEITADIEITYCSTPGSENKRTYSTRCVVGTNAWSIEGDFLLNGHVAYWFTGTNIIKHTVITKQFPNTWNVGFFPGTRQPEVGSEFTRIYNSLDGHAPTEMDSENVAWLAFCSARFLKDKEQQMPLLIPVDRRAPYGNYTTNSLVFFEDSLRLPKQGQFHTARNELHCWYDVQQETNVLGWNFPLRFEVMQCRQGSGDKWEHHASIIGRVTAIRPSDPPIISRLLPEQ